MLDPGSRMLAPAMIALALGDPESRAIAEDVVRERIVDPMAQWLGSGEARAAVHTIVAMTTGFSIYQRNMDHRLDHAEREKCGRLLARAIQDIVERG